ncbi:hypothetical protein [Streptomyces chartreusis]|uniref:hypothetical protein n=1 Tax=Streptomyces chartreusis TaxID=1969 RepID=UPI003630E8C6
MTTSIMTRAAAGTTVVATGPEYWCDPCSTFHSGPCPAVAHRELGDLLARMVRESDARIPAERRARRTLQEMLPGYERQPVLVLHRPVMADGPSPAPVMTGGGMQCDVCQGWFGVLPSPAGTQATVSAPTAWTCSACQNLGS